MFPKLTLFGLLIFAAFAHAQNYVPGEMIVKLKSQSGTEGFVTKVRAARAMRVKAAFPGMKMYHFALPQGQKVEDAVANMKNDPTVEYAEPNYYIHKSADTGIQQAFSAEEIMATSSQSQTTNLSTGAPIGAQQVWTANSMPAVRPIVAVVDTGLDTTHPVITGTQALWTNPGEIPANGIDDDKNGYVDDVHGWNYVDNSPTIYDDDNHGTHVTGIILSLDQNIFASTLHASKVQIMPLKFLNGQGTGTTADAISAIYYAANMGAAVINNSWGGADYSAALNDAVAYSYKMGSVFVAAAGNDSSNNDSTPMYPASYDVPNVVSVAATTDQDYLASFSNYGDATVHLGSPGVVILSTIPGGNYATMSGTSMATPFVSGTAAQMKVSSPSMLPYQVKQLLLNQVTQVPSLAARVNTSGRLLASNSVSAAKIASVSSSEPTYVPSYQGDRQLASNMSGAAGCGLVKALKDGDEPPVGSAFGAMAFILLPLLALVIMRVRAPEKRRKYERFKVNSDVRIMVGDRELVGSVSSLSLGGAQVNTDALLQDGGMITMSISSPSGDEKIEVAGRVVWSDANKAYGVAFDQAPQSVLARIGDWTQNLKKAAN